MSVVYSPALKYSGNYPERDSRNNHIHHHHQQQHCQQPQQQQISGLLRYRSAPSSLLTNLVEGSHGWVDEREEGSRRGHVPSSLGSDMEGVLGSCSKGGWSDEKQEGGGGCCVLCDDGDQIVDQSQELCSSVMMNSAMNPGNCSNLLFRQKSSPPGFFSNFSLTNIGFAPLGEQATASSCPRRMPQIAESGNETLEQEEEARTCVETGKRRENNGSNKCYVPSFTSDFWENSSFRVQKTASDNNEFMFSPSDALESQQADEFGYQNVGLTHQMSLPSGSTKMGAIERLLQIQGSVPCKIRAKRGFATHPRSIAERVRRTRISERIKKLQELFPKSDKQTSTADMLDSAVDYIKDLQEQVKMLTDKKAACKCSSIQKQYSSAWT